MAEVGSMSAENLHILTVEKLKAELLSHGLDTTGLKAVLVERLADYYQSLPIEEALAPTSGRFFHFKCVCTSAIFLYIIQIF